MSESGAPPATLSAGGFRGMMAAFPSGVGVVTALDEQGEPRGMTCSSICSVTLEPPTLLVCLRSVSPTCAAVLGRGRFAVNLLHQDSQPIAELFASGDPARFERVHWRADELRAPHLPDDTHAVADCVVTSYHDVGDHTVVYGEVLDVTQGPPARPLLYGLRRYATWPHQ
ncbi:flavin reductase family protein [Amycolatopsis ultiminotia]|uniref:Flavin reductase family protein n=1 Tax=Amycolatopsis ultiminotia TaxID=543629 RepID=A0ABP6YLE4_9PSEU